MLWVSGLCSVLICESLRVNVKAENAFFFFFFLKQVREVNSKRLNVSLLNMSSGGTHQCLRVL